MKTIKILISMILFFSLLCGFVEANWEWEIQTVDPGLSNGWDSKISLDSNGYPHITYGDSYGETMGEQGDGLKYAYWTGSSWEIEVIDPYGGSPSIILDSNDLTHMCYIKNNSLIYEYWNGITWISETLDSNVQSYCSIDLDSNNFPHISYCDSFSRLKYTYWTGNSWQIDSILVLGSGEVFYRRLYVFYNSLVIDSNNEPHICFFEVYDDEYNPTLDLKYIHLHKGEWEKTTVDTEGDVGRQCKILLDGNGRPHISYLKSVENPRYKYAHWDGERWNVETISPNDWRWSYSLILDSNNIAHIAFQIEGDLVYANKTEGIWKSEIISEGDVYGGEGNWISIDIDKNGYIHISYSNSGKGLRYAYQKEIIITPPDNETTDESSIDNGNLDVNDNETPGFELYISLVAITLYLLWKRKR